MIRPERFPDSVEYCSEEIFSIDINLSTQGTKNVKTACSYVVSLSCLVAIFFQAMRINLDQ